VPWPVTSVDKATIEISGRDGTRMLAALNADPAMVTPLTQKPGDAKEMPRLGHRSRARFQDPLFIITRILNKLYTSWLRITYPFAFMGKKVSIHYTCPINRLTAHRIKIGNHVRVHKDVYLGASLPPEEEGEPVLIIDDNCVIHWRSQVDAKNHIHLERDVLVSQDVLIIDQNHAYEDVTLPIERQGNTSGGRIRIGQGSWIAHGAAIICSQGELVLGRNCVVAAHAVVTRSAPPYSVLSGNPARVVKQYDPAKQAWVLGSVRPAGSEAAK
jgi:acetyltransferase-like isoleucine patch superfamily enzyme